MSSGPMGHIWPLGRSLSTPKLAGWLPWGTSSRTGQEFILPACMMFALGAMMPPTGHQCPKYPPPKKFGAKNKVVQSWWQRETPSGLRLVVLWRCCSEKNPRAAVSRRSDVRTSRSSNQPGERHALDFEQQPTMPLNQRLLVQSCASARRAGGNSRAFWLVASFHENPETRFDLGNGSSSRRTNPKLKEPMFR